MEVEKSSEALVSYHITTQWRNPQDHELVLHCREDLKSCNSAIAKLREYKYHTAQTQIIIFFAYLVKYLPH
jgi:hypothetical protein